MATTPKDPGQMMAEMFQAGHEFLQQIGGQMTSAMQQAQQAAAEVAQQAGQTARHTAQQGGQPAPELAAQWHTLPHQFAEMQRQALEKMTAGWWTAAQDQMLGAAAAAEGDVKDKRFAGEKWADPRFDVLRRSYLAYAEFMRNAIEAAPVDEETKGRMSFGMRQALDALSPANFFATNPEAAQLALETGGQSVVDGMTLFMRDLAQGRVSMTDESAFEVGKDLAVTPGAVIYQNDLIQLIQYTPATAQVYQRPLVMVPPCINKFYILDMQPSNSFVRYAVEQGHTVFMVSWRNVPPELGTLTWDDYLAQGVLKAIDIAREITGEAEVNTLGFCIGGTLLASALGVLAANGERKAASMTLLTTILDFSDTGELGLLVTPDAVAAREAAIGQGGLLQGKELAQVFASLRANDLIWQYVVNSYLKGQAPPAFDLLFWNSDATNLPGPMFCWYIRNTYLENKLMHPGKTVQLDAPVDLSEVDVPTYVYASREDHIVPWQTAFASRRTLGGATTFALGASGHIAGVINAPAKKKRNYWVEGAATDDAAEWFDRAQNIPGSWWPHWSEWLAQVGGEKVPARTPGTEKYKIIEPAPGSYVRARAE